MRVPPSPSQPEARGEAPAPSPSQPEARSEAPAPSPSQGEGWGEGDCSKFGDVFESPH